jgi:uncharacterized membrane protein (GlpM family)
MEHNYAPIDPFASNWRRTRIPLRAWIAVGVLAYIGFVAACFYMESFARAKFKVPSKADIATISDRSHRIRTEAARTNALAEMRSWTPYVVYDTAVGVVTIGGTLVAAILGAIAIWRGVRRDSIFAAKGIIVGVLLVMLATLLFFAWPTVVAEKRFEATRTTLTDGS